MSSVFSPGPSDRLVVDQLGKVHRVPDGWILVPPGDPGLTRRIKQAGEYWQVQEKRGRKIFSRGVWAPEDTVRAIEQGLASERATESYSRKQAASRVRREREQGQYVEDFNGAVLAFLNFHARYTDLAQQMAELIVQHATPVGSGTVARTKRIPIERRASAAVVAWMRHQTTDYDNMAIARVKGKRREVRRMLAEQSNQILKSYRQGLPVGPDCPLIAAVRNRPGNADQLRSGSAD